MTARIGMIASWILLALVALVVLRLVMLSMSAPKPPTLGITDGRLAPCPKSPNCVSSQAADPSHRVEPLAAPGPGDEALAHAAAAIASMPGARVVTAGDGYLHAEFTSRLFRFVDDLELRWDGERELFDVRSASRVGHSDLGVNRHRVEALRALLARAE